MLGAALAAAACGGEAAPANPPAAGGRGGAQTAAAVPVTTAPVIQKAVPLTIEGIGTVIAASTVAVHSQVTGELTSVNFIEGDEVTEGQIIVTLDKRPLEATLNLAQATLERDLAQTANARAQAVRYQDLLKRGIATHEQVDQMVANAGAADATVVADRANVDSAKVQLDYATIRAPLTGKTGLLQVHPGNLVRAGDTGAIVTINKITPVYVSFAIPEAMLPILRQELTDHHYDLVLWQTGTVEAVLGQRPDALRGVLEDGAEVAVKAEADLVLIDPQFSRFLRANADLSPYETVLQQMTGTAGVTLFHRFDLTQGWVTDGRIDLERVDKDQRDKTITLLHNCLGLALAQYILTGANEH